MTVEALLQQLRSLRQQRRTDGRDSWTCNTIPTKDERRGRVA